MEKLDLKITSESESDEDCLSRDSDNFLLIGSFFTFVSISESSEASSESDVGAGACSELSFLVLFQ